MNKLRSRTNNVKDALTGVCVAVSVAMMSIMPAYADEISNAINGGLKKVYDVITAIVLPIAAIAAAICAVKIIANGDDREMQSAKKTLIRIIIGLAIVYLAPFLVSTISGWFNNTGASIW